MRIGTQNDVSVSGVSKEMDDDLQDMIKRMKAVVEEETKTTALKCGGAIP